MRKASDGGLENEATGAASRRNAAHRTDPRRPPTAMFAAPVDGIQPTGTGAGGGRMESELDALIRRADTADPSAADQLFTLLYHELHRVAERNLRRANGAATLGTTTLLHETYLNIAARS